MSSAPVPAAWLAKKHAIAVRGSMPTAVAASASQNGTPVVPSARLVIANGELGGRRTSAMIPKVRADVPPMSARRTMRARGLPSIQRSMLGPATMLENSMPIAAPPMKPSRAPPRPAHMPKTHPPRMACA